MRRRPNISAFVEASGGIETRVHSTVRMYVPLEFLVRVEVVARNRSGPFTRRHGLDLMGWVHLPELKMDFVFRPREGTEGEDDPWGTATVIPSGFRLPIPPLAVDRAQPERRDLWFVTPEPDRPPSTLEHYAGRCDQRLLTFVREIRAKAMMDVACRAGESPEGRTQVEVWGDVAFERLLSMKLLLREEAAAARPGTMDRKELRLIVPGSRVSMERQSVSAPTGSHPWIGMRVSDGSGRVLCAEHAIADGRGSW